MSRAIPCPSCGRLNDQHAHTGGVDAPSPGDVAICWGCGQPAVFVATAYGLGQRAATETERVEILADPEVRRALDALGLAVTPQQALRTLRGDLS